MEGFPLLIKQTEQHVNEIQMESGTWRRRNALNKQAPHPKHSPLYGTAIPEIPPATIGSLWTWLGLVLKGK
jgi:hypothetical protein